MYEELSAELRIFETVCKHCNKPDTAFLARRAADAIEKLDMKLHGANAAIAGMQREIERMVIDSADSKSQWVPVTERLPEKPYGCLAIVWDSPRYDGDMFLNYYPEFVGWDGETWNDADGEEIPLDVVYWMKMPKIPEPPKESE